MPRQRKALTSTVLAIAVTVTGCGGAKPGITNAARTPSLVMPPGSTQPFDAIRGDLLQQIDDALRAHDLRCAREEGFTPAAVVNVREPFHDIKFRASDFGTTDVDIARRDGLLAGGALIDPATEAPTQTRRDAEAIAKCDEKARKLLSKATSETYDNYIALANDLASQYFARMNDQYQPFRLRLFQCVETKGWHADDVAALSADADLRKHYQVVTARATVNEATGKETYLPTANEISLAVALADCRRETGYSNGVFQKSRAIQGQIISRNEAKLAEANSQLERAVEDAARKLA